MKRVIGVIGSPRRNGNTHILVSKILEGAKKEGAITESIFLNNLTIKECDGCHVCWEGAQCSKNDDMNSLYPKIIESNVIIFGTPVYWYGPTALMKGFMDRFVYFNCEQNRKKIRGKSAVIAIPFEEDNPQTASPLEIFFKKSLDYLQMNIIGKIVVPGVTKRGEIAEREDIIKQAFKLGIKLAE